MADAPELPEAKDPFEKTIALTIAIIAVILSFVENQGDNAKTDAIVKTGEMSNQWAYYQSKSLKENLAETSATLLGNLTPTAPDAAKAKAEELRAEVVRYEGEKKVIRADAEELQNQVKAALAIDDRCDMASLFLQISVVLCSVAILVRWRAIFIVGVLAGLAGTIVGASAFMM